MNREGKLRLLRCGNKIDWGRRWGKLKAHQTLRSKWVSFMLRERLRMILAWMVGTLRVGAIWMFNLQKLILNLNQIRISKEETNLSFQVLVQALKIPVAASSLPIWLIDQQIYKVLKWAKSFQIMVLTLNLNLLCLSLCMIFRKSHLKIDHQFLLNSCSVKKKLFPWLKLKDQNLS